MSPDIEEREDLRNLLSIIEDKKGESARIIDMRDHSIATSFFVLANGTNPKHVRAIAENLEEKYNRDPQGKEGLDDGGWVALDYGEIMVHLFDEEVRDFYDLDDLWVDREFSLERANRK
ncbi:ribosome silencing factor [Candidatus Bipolaricaulota bacterium]|nr:ribosome silencing factor [Candidatus Bipolaricaulota bacterium]